MQCLVLFMYLGVWVWLLCHHVCYYICVTVLCVCVCVRVCVRACVCVCVCVCVFILVLLIIIGHFVLIICAKILFGKIKYRATCSWNLYFFQCVGTAERLWWANFFNYRDRYRKQNEYYWSISRYHRTRTVFFFLHHCGCVHMTFVFQSILVFCLQRKAARLHFIQVIILPSQAVTPLESTRTR